MIAMIRINHLLKSGFSAATLMVIVVMPCRGVTSADLAQRIAKGESLTVIDLRNTGLFQRGHLPGSINIPASVVPHKELPPLGKVVVYDAGLAADEAAAAVVALNAKKGIQAEALEGGFAAWEASQRSSTRQSGVQPEELPMISYDQLKKTQGDNTVLVDLRKNTGGALPQLASGSPPPEPLTDLQKTFPKTSGVTTSPFKLPQRRQADGSSSEEPLVVLIDNGDGVTAQQMARTARANGMRRVVILAGGEATLSREGKPGLQRIGTTLDIRRPTQ